jgi:hypothetical protein
MILQGCVDNVRIMYISLVRRLTLNSRSGLTIVDVESRRSFVS